jgi:hypothetical protein
VGRKGLADLALILDKRKTLESTEKHWTPIYLQLLG